jgi:hypothetical protein
MHRLIAIEWDTLAFARPGRNKGPRSSLALAPATETGNPSRRDG